MIDEATLSDMDLDDLFVLRAKVDGLIVKAVDEADRSQTFRDDGATSTEAWLAERYGVSTASARAYVHVGEKASELPHLVGSLCAGEVSFDKVRVLADVATASTERALCEKAKETTVRQLGEIARSAAELARASSPAQGRSEHDRRFVRFNDEHRSISVQLPRYSYAEARARVEAAAKEIPSEGETPWDHRCADALMELLGSSGAGSSAPAPRAPRAARPPRPAPMSWSSTPPSRPWSTDRATTAPWPATSSVTA